MAISKEIARQCMNNLEGRGITSKFENNTVYACVLDSELELSEFEINFQAEEWRKNELGEEEDEA